MVAALTTSGIVHTCAQHYSSLLRGQDCACVPVSWSFFTAAAAAAAAEGLAHTEHMSAVLKQYC
jgi:hypothetical protein